MGGHRPDYFVSRIRRAGWKPAFASAVVVLAVLMPGAGNRAATAIPRFFDTYADIALNSSESCAGRPATTTLPPLNARIQIRIDFGPGPGSAATIRFTPQPGFFFGYGGAPATGPYTNWAYLTAQNPTETWDVKYNPNRQALETGLSGAFYKLRYTDPGLGSCDVTATGQDALHDPLPPIMTSTRWELWIDPNGSAGACSQAAPCANLLDAWALVTANPADVTIHANAGEYKGSGAPLNLVVPDGVHAEIIGAGSLFSIFDGCGTDSGFLIGGGGALKLSYLRIAGMQGPHGAIYKAGAGELDLSGVGLQGSSSTGDGGGLAVMDGKAILDSVLIGGNRAAEYGGGIYVGPGATLIGSNLTISGNRAGEGGAGAATNGGTMQLSSSTIYMNRGPYAVGVDYDLHQSANQAGSSVTITNSIIGVNGDMPSCSEPVTSGGHNIDAGNSCGLHATGDLVNTDPKLARFDFYGGGVQTLAFYSDSPAYNGGGPTCPATDGRGAPRLQGPACDIGAFESQAATTELVIASATSSDPSPAIGALTTLTIVVRNDGGTANGAGVRVDLHGLEVVSATPGKGAFGTPERSPYWLVGALAPGEQATLTLSVRNVAHARAGATFTARAYERNATAGKNTGTVALNAGLPQVIVLAVAADK